jgi:hypothetical protein
MVITCRTGEFNYRVPKSVAFEIAPLKREQIEEFALKWLDNQVMASKFISEIYRSPFSDTAIRPLSLAHLCAIYEPIGKIPEKPKTVYRKIVTLLLEEWDEQRGIIRLSRYAGFEVDRKLEFLCSVAFYLTTTKGSSVFSRRDFLDCYRDICVFLGLPRDQGNTVAIEIESHTGLFLQSGYDKFEFAHKSIQEYLTAEYIVRLPSIPSDPNIIQNLGAEIAVSASISSNPTEYVTYIGLRALISMMLPEGFWSALVNRLIIEKPDIYQTEAVVIALYNILSCGLCSERAVRGDIANSGPLNLEIYNQFLALAGGADWGRVIRTHYRIPAQRNSRGGLSTVHRKPYRDEVKLGIGSYLLPEQISIPTRHLIYCIVSNA